MVNFFIVVVTPQKENTTTPERTVEDDIRDKMDEIAMIIEEFSGVTNPSEELLRELAIEELGLK